MVLEDVPIAQQHLTVVVAVALTSMELLKAQMEL
jgi:hypothetical protein